jgi:hypothetical protein
MYAFRQSEARKIGDLDIVALMTPWRPTSLGALIKELPPLKQMASLNRSMAMNIFYIIGVVVVIIVVAGFLGLHV